MENFYANHQSKGYIPRLLPRGLHDRGAGGHADRLAEKAAERKRYRHRAHYSLDRGDGIENSVLFVAMTPDELYEKKLTNQQLYAAISKLPEKQAKRIYAYFFMNMDEIAIAKSEGVSHQAVHKSIQQGLKGIEKYLKKFF